MPKIKKKKRNLDQSDSSNTSLFILTMFTGETEKLSLAMEGNERSAVDPSTVQVKSTDTELQNIWEILSLPGHKFHPPTIFKF